MRIFVLFFIFVNLYIVNASLNGNCNLMGVTPQQWLTSFDNDGVNDNIQDPFKVFDTENVQGVQAEQGDYDKYFSVIFSSNTLTIAPSGLFKDYENLQNSAVGTPIMVLNILFTCTEGSGSLSFFQPIIDLNTYTPSFTNSLYSSKLPMPLPSNFDLGCLFTQSIEACDNDITNVQVSFTIEPATDFSISWSGTTSSTNKCHKATIKTLGPLALTKTTQYTLTVTDMGDVPKSGTSVLEIEVDEETSIPQTPNFRSAYYAGNYNNNDETHSVVFDSAITLENINSDVSFELKGAYSNHFGYTYKDGTLSVTLNKNFPIDVLENNVVVILTVEASILNAEYPGRTVLIVYLPKQVCPELTTLEPTPCTTQDVPSCPTCPTCTTEQTETVTECPTCETCAPTTDCPNCATPSCPPTECNTLPTVTECPQTNCSESTTVIVTECPTECPPCTTSTSSDCPITTEFPPCPTTTTGIECPVTEPSDCPPCFTTPTGTECPVTCPEPSDCPPCFTTPTGTECPVTCPEPSDCPPYLTTPTGTECPVTCPEPSDCPPCFTTPTGTECPVTCPEPSDCPPYLTTPTGTECPVTCPEPSDCPPCLTTLSTECSSYNTPDPSPSSECPTTECPPCPTTPNPTDPSITFEQEDYIFNVPSSPLLTVGIVKADTTINEKVEYSLEPIAGESIPKQITINKNNGILSVKEALSVGTYKFQVKAVGLVSAAIDRANVLINVMDATYSLIVKEIDESTKSTIGLPCPEGHSSCVYKLVDQYPQTEIQLFNIVNGAILSTQPIDLGMEEIRNLIIPQFTLTLELTESSYPNRNLTSYNTNSVISKEDHYKYALLPEVLPNRQNTLIASILINDINNNPPKFEEGDKIVVGYPSGELSNQLTTTYLVQVKATDVDLNDFNSDIRYSVDSSNFIIHSKSGVIYMGENNFNSPEVFHVTATDQDGVGLSASLEIEVVPLEEKHLTILKVKNKVLEDLDDILKVLSDESNITIKYLSATVVADESSKGIIRKVKRLFNKLRTQRDENHSVRVVIYAFDANNKIMETEDVQNTLESSEVIEDVSTDTWTPPVPCNTGDSDDVNTTGFIAAIAVLGTLLVVFIMGAGVLYYFKIRKPRKQEPYETMSNEDSGSTHSKQDNEISKRRPTGFVFTPPPIDDDETDKSSTNSKYDDIDSPPKINMQNSYNTKPFVETRNVTKSFMESSPKNDPPPTYKFEDDDDEKDVKKTVSFLPTVQKINIPIDVEENDDNDINIRL